MLTPTSGFFLQPFQHNLHCYQMWPKKEYSKIRNIFTHLIFSTICMNSQIFMFCSLRGRRVLGNHVGYQHTKCLWRKAKTSKRKSNCWPKYALGIPIKGQLWPSPWTYVVWVVTSQVAFPLDLVNLIEDLSIQFCFPVLSWTVGSGTQNDIWRESFNLTTLLTFHLLCYHNHQSLIYSSRALILL